MDTSVLSLMMTVMTLRCKLQAAGASCIVQHTLTSISVGVAGWPVNVLCSSRRGFTMRTRAVGVLDFDAKLSSERRVKTISVPAGKRCKTPAKCIINMCAGLVRERERLV